MRALDTIAFRRMCELRSCKKQANDCYCKAQPLASTAEQSARCSFSSAVSARQPNFWLAHSELFTVPAIEDKCGKWDIEHRAH